MAVFDPQALTPTGLPSLTGGAPSASPVVQQANQLTTIAAPTTFKTTDDELTQLQPLTLKASVSEPGINFPGIMFGEVQDKSLIAHRYPHLDGARVENMGAHEQVYRIRAILTNNIFPGTKETWKQGDLFPNTFNKLLALLADNNPKVFVHPIKGNTNVQVKGWEYQLVAKGPRDGAVVDIVLWETIIGDVASITSQPTASSASTAAAANLDATIDAVNPKFNPPKLSLSQFFGKINSLLRSATSIPNNTVQALSTDLFGITSGLQGIAAAPAYAINSTIQTINAASNTLLGTTIGGNPPTVSGVPSLNFVNYTESTMKAVQALTTLNSTNSSSSAQALSKTNTALEALKQHYIDQNSAEVAPVIEAIKQYQYQILRMKNQVPQATPNQQYVSVATYVTPSNMTWLELSNILHNEISDLLDLNQNQNLKSMWVKTNTQIQYYQS